MVTCKTKNITNQSQVLNWKLNFQPNVTIKTYFSFNIIKYRLKKRGGLLPHKVWAYTSVCVCVCINCSINTMLSLTNKHFEAHFPIPKIVMDLPGLAPSVSLSLPSEYFGFVRKFAPWVWSKHKFGSCGHQSRTSASFDYASSTEPNVLIYYETRF